MITVGVEEYSQSSEVVLSSKDWPHLIGFRHIPESHSITVKIALKLTEMNYQVITLTMRASDFEGHNYFPIFRPNGLKASSLNGKKCKYHLNVPNSSYFTLFVCCQSNLLTADHRVALDIPVGDV